MLAGVVVCPEYFQADPDDGVDLEADVPCGADDEFLRTDQLEDAVLPKDPFPEWDQFLDVPDVNGLDVDGSYGYGQGWIGQGWIEPDTAGQSFDGPDGDALIGDGLIGDGGDGRDWVDAMSRALSGMVSRQP